MNQTTDDRQAVQAYIESMREDFENEHPGTAEALRLHDEAMKHYIPAARALAKPVFRITLANSNPPPQRDSRRKRPDGSGDGDPAIGSGG